jgi:hypothetical protein
VDHLVHSIADLHLDIISLADYADIDPSQLTQKIQRGLWFLTQSQPQAVLLATLADCLLDVLGHTIEAVRGTRSIDPLVGTLMIVIPHPVVQTLTRVRERSEHRFFKELAPDRLPEPFYLAQGHWVVGR